MNRIPLHNILGDWSYHHATQSGQIRDFSLHFASIKSASKNRLISIGRSRCKFTRSYQGKELTINDEFVDISFKNTRNSSSHRNCTNAPARDIMVRLQLLSTERLLFTKGRFMAVFYKTSENNQIQHSEEELDVLEEFFE